MTLPNNWQNPFATGTQSAPPTGATPQSPQTNKKNELPPEPTSADLYVSPSDLRDAWDYKTAQTGMFGESLPEEATGWTPYGTPYFGDEKGSLFGSITGKFKEYAWHFTRDVQAPDESEWQALKDKWAALGEKQKELAKTQPRKQGEVSEETRQLEKEQFGTALQAVKMGWQSLESDDSLVSPVVKLVNVGLKGIGDLFNVLAIGAERAQGTSQAVEKTAEELGLETLPDFLPEDNWFTRWLNDVNPITKGYAALQVAMSPQKGKWDVFAENVKEEWDASRIYYTSVYDPAVKEEYLRRARMGDNPELLAMELENPYAELVGQLALDPLNFMGLITKAKTIDRVLDASETAVRASGTLAEPRAVQILDEFGKLGKGDDVKTAQLMDEFVDIRRAKVEEIAAKGLTQRYTFASLAAESSRKVTTREAQNFIGMVQSVASGQGRSYDEISDMVVAGVMSVSKNKDEAAKGIAALMKSDTPKLMFSETADKTFLMVRRMLESADGALDFGRIRRLGQMTDPQKFMDEAVSLITASAKSNFATVDEMADAYKLASEADEIGGTVSKATRALSDQFKALPKGVLAANFLNSKAQKVYSPLNRVLGAFYFSLQGGVAVKNVLNNSIQILIDQGPKAFFRPVKWTETLADGSVIEKTRPAFWSPKKVEADLERMLGFKTSLASGFDTQTTITKARGPFAALMDAGEKSAANYVVWNTMKDSMKKLLTERRLGDAAVLRQAGMNETQVKHFFRLLNDNYGDTVKTLEQFRTLHGNGRVETWRLLDYLPKHYEDGFRELDIYDEIADLAKTGKSRQEIEDTFARLKSEVAARGETATGDGARMAPEHKQLESIQELENALLRGELTDGAANEVLRNMLTAAEEARHTYSKTMEEVFFYTSRRIPDSQAKQFFTRMQNLRDADFAGNAQARQLSEAALASTKKLSNEIVSIKKPTRQQLHDYWKLADLAGDPPLDLTKQQLTNALWDKYRTLMRGKFYEDYYATYFKESQSIVEDLGKLTDITELRASLTTAEMAVMRANVARTATYSKGVFHAAAGKQDVLSLAKVFEIPTATEAGVPLDKYLMNIIKKHGDTAAKTLDEVTPDEAIAAFEKWRDGQGLKKIKLPEGQRIVPAYPDGTQPSIARGWNENTRMTLYALDKTKNEMLARFGQVVEGKLDNAVETALRTYTGQIVSRVGEGKAIALKAAEHWRDFILHNYGAKTYGDLIFAHIMPYQFWYSRTYKNWMKRIASDPHIIAGYFKYKQFIQKENADSPEWFRNQLEVNNIFGIQLEHPLIFNLEAALNPLNGVLGADFNDPEKRVNWWTATLDDMGKMGPSLWAPLQWAVAAGLSMQGEDDAAQRWAGRAIPETSALKALFSVTGLDDRLPESKIIPGLKYGELDPMVNLFSGGIDPYERGRVGRAFGLMIEEGLITEEQAIDAANSQEGPLWDEAVRRSINLRATSSLVSWGLGVGFKPRTQADKEIDAMFSELNMLYTLNKDNSLTPDQYRQSMDALREKYKFMDAVLLSRKGGDKRDSAFAYNVLGRLPPGTSRDVLLSVGLTDEDIQKFYDSKGFISGKGTGRTNAGPQWQQTEKDKFMAAIVDLSAMLALPDYATRTEWNQAKSEYGRMNDFIETQLGADIWDMVSAYYDMRDTDPDLAAQFKDAHPQITQALQMRQEGVINNPLLYEYYGSLDKVESYYDGKTRQTLTAEFGDLAPLWAEYYDLKLQGQNKAANRFYKSHPELKAYSARKRELEDVANRAFVDFASKMPEPGGEAVLREDFVPQTAQQEQILEALQPQRIPSWDEIVSVAGSDISPAMQTLVGAYWTQGEELSYAANSQLEYLASRYGQQLGVDSPESLLRIMGVALLNPQAATPSPAQEQGGWQNPFAP